MAKKYSRKSRRGHKKSRSHRKGSRRQRGGVAPVGYSNPFPMGINLAQGQQFAAYHAQQHGGGVGTYPDAVQQSALLPAELVPSSRLLPLNAAFDYIRQFGPEADMKGGRRRGRKGRKGSRKSRKGRKIQRGGDFVRWGGGGRRRRGTRRMRGGSAADMGHPMDVAEETKMLIPPSLQQQAGLNPEWKLAENPNSFAPNLN